VRILRFKDNRIGILKDGNMVVDVSDAIPHRTIKSPQQVMEEVIEHWSDYRKRFQKIAAKKKGVSLSRVKLLPPIPRPSKVLAAFVNYMDRPDRTPDTLPPEFFYKAPEVVGQGGTVLLVDIPPVICYHAEAELAFIMGKRAKNVKEADAMKYVFGYAPFFDISARGLTRRTQFLHKGQDTYACLGPWITTKDDVPDPHNLVVKSWVNGKPRQDYSTTYMAQKIPAQIAWLSKYLQLQPGDVIATGTYHEGLGPVNPGETLEIEIERLGRAKFQFKGNSPRKDTEWIPGVTPSSPPSGPVGITKV